MKKCLFWIPAFILLAACGVKKADELQQQFISEFTKELILPVTVDESFITRLDTLEAMDIPRLEKIKKDSMDKDLAGELRNSINGCIFIEKLKQNGRYAGYTDSLDIGMLKNAMAFKVGKINAGDGSYLLLWGINEGSYEADPGYSGVSIIASYPDRNGGFTHVIVAEEYHAGDPPSLMSRKTKSEIRAGEIVINTLTTIEDMDAHTKATESSYLRLEVKDGELKVVQKAKGK